MNFDNFLRDYFSFNDQRAGGGGIIATRRTLRPIQNSSYGNRCQAELKSKVESTSSGVPRRTGSFYPHDEERFSSFFFYLFLGRES